MIYTIYHISQQLCEAIKIGYTLLTQNRPNNTQFTETNFARWSYRCIAKGFPDTLTTSLEFSIHRLIKRAKIYIGPVSPYINRYPTVITAATYTTHSSKVQKTRSRAKKLILRTKQITRDQWRH